MKKNHIDPLEIIIKEDSYVLDFDIDSVKEFGRYSIANNGKISDDVLIKYALLKNHKYDLTINKKALEIQETLTTLSEEDEMSYRDVMEYLINLFVQTIDDEAKNVEPATATIEKDNSVNVVFDNEKLKLTFLRADLKDAIINGDSAFGYNSLLELYVVGTSMLKLATKHYNRRFNVKFHDNLFLALWATKFNKDTEHMFSEVINALSFHIKEVANSGIKNSKPAIKITKRTTEE